MDPHPGLYAAFSDVPDTVRAMLAGREGWIADVAGFHGAIRDAMRQRVPLQGAVGSSAEESDSLRAVCPPGAMLLSRAAYRALQDPALRSHWGAWVFRYGEPGSFETLQRPFLTRGLKVAADVVAGDASRTSLKREIDSLMAGMRGLLHAYLDPSAVYHVTLMGLYRIESLNPMRQAQALQAWERYRDTLRELGGHPDDNLPDWILLTEFTTNAAEMDFTLPYRKDQPWPGAREAVATNQVSTIPDTAADLDDAERQADLRCLARRRIASFLAMPMSIGRSVRAVINVTCSLPQLWSDEAARQRQFLFLLEPLVLTLRVLMGAWSRGEEDDPGYSGA